MCGPLACEKEGCTWSEPHRRECEAREVMSWEHSRRRAHYERVLKARGKAALDELREEVNRQWARRND